MTTPPRTMRELRAEIARLRGRVDELEVGREGRTVAQHTLRQSESLAEAVLASASQGIIVIAGDGRIELVNPRAEELFGYAPGELVGRPLEVLLPARLRETHVGHRAGFFTNPRVRPMGQGLELAGTRKDGAEFPVEISLSYAAVGGGIRAVAFVTDITQRKAVADALHRSEARALALFEAASEGVVVVDRRGRIVAVNAKTEELFGYARADLLGQPVEMLMPERYREAHPRHRTEYFAGPRVRPMGRGLDLAGRRKDGSEFPIEISLSPIETDEGPQSVALVTDITQRLAVERATRQAERLASLGSMSAGIAHEINNPIGIITSRIELMLIDAAEHALPPAVVDDLHVLHRNAMRVAGIAQRFLSFARQSPAERISVELNRVVAQTVELVERQIGTGVRIVPSLDEATPPSLGHANALQQVLLNPIMNARDAMEGQGEIRIATGVAPDRPGRVWLKVTDTGPGIAPETMSQIFDPFYTTKTSGTGLGLSVSYGIIRDHNGTVDVESALGQGTTFLLTFPALPAEG
jgi:PAS domain S-box-containing protein